MQENKGPLENATIHFVIEKPKPVSTKLRNHLMSRFHFGFAQIHPKPTILYKKANIASGARLSLTFVNSVIN